ncbi:TolC family protein [Poriferisphaera sp. WC338]|uniref:TolC family protein n=1 Tax=Poriferisphaera sp. WC338 TaxID=3425129 RepID=UPI003D816AA7
MLNLKPCIPMTFMSTVVRCGMILLLLCLSGCAAEPFQDWDAETYAAMSGDWGKYSQWDGELEAAITKRTKLKLTKRLDDPPASDEMIDITKGLLITPNQPSTEIDRGVEWYVQVALDRNPSILAARNRVQRLKNIAPQVSSLDFPTAQFQAGELAQTAAGQVEFLANVQQKVPFPGKLKARGKIALQDASIAAADLDRVQLQVIADVRRAYWRLFYAVRGIEVAQANYQLLDQFQRIAEARVKAGQTSIQDVLRAAVEIGVLNEQLVRFIEQKRSSTAMLNQLMNRVPTAGITSPPPVEMQDFDINLEMILKQAQIYSPEIQAARANVGKYREALKLARLENYPDFLFGFTYAPVRSNGPVADINGNDQWWFTVGFTIPIWFERIQGAKYEAFYGVKESLASLREANNVVAFRVIDAIANVEAQRDEVILFRDQILPQARQTLESSVSGYQTGELDFLTLIDNWQQLLRFELLQYQNLTELEQAFADLRETIGRDVRVRQGNNGQRDINTLIEQEVSGEWPGKAKQIELENEEKMDQSPDMQ